MMAGGEQSMIEINLLPGRKRKKRAGAGFALPDFGVLAGKVRDPLLLGTLGIWAVVLVVVGYTFLTERAGAGRLASERDNAAERSLLFSGMIEEKQQQEKLRDSLVAELTSIREIDSDRYIWAHIMEEVAKALPDFTWLVGLEFVPALSPDAVEEADVLARPPVRFTIDGRAEGIRAYTRFLRNLGNSPWIADVEPGATQTVLDDERPVTTFTITGTFQQADSAFVRSVPLRESVR